MRNITFIGQINSTYGRGRDKQQRKRKSLLAGVGTVGGASVVGGALGARNNERAYSRFIYEGMMKKNPTNTNINAIRKNFKNYKMGQGSLKADVFKKQFSSLSREGGLKGAVFLGGVTAGALGLKVAYNKLKNRKTIKIGNKTLSYQKPGT